MAKKAWPPGRARLKTYTKFHCTSTFENNFKRVRWNVSVVDTKLCHPCCETRNCRYAFLFPFRRLCVYTPNSGIILSKWRHDYSPSWFRSSTMPFLVSRTTWYAQPFVTDENAIPPVYPEKSISKTIRFLTSFARRTGSVTVCP